MFNFSILNLLLSISIRPLSIYSSLYSSYIVESIEKSKSMLASILRSNGDEMKNYIAWQRSLINRTLEIVPIKNLSGLLTPSVKKENSAVRDYRGPCPSGVQQQVSWFACTIKVRLTPIRPVKTGRIAANPNVVFNRCMGILS